jgi:hypothetical protein
MDSSSVGYFRAIAVDYDGTLSETEQPSEDVLTAVAEVRASGRKVVLVTGRILAELRELFPAVDEWFDAIVAENGAVLSIEGATRVLAPPVEFELDEALVERGVPFRRGQVLLAARAAHETEIQSEIRRLGLENQLTRNRGELMVLPPGISKGFGVVQALGDLGVSNHSTIAIGDGENDHSLLGMCELGVAVANAVEGLRRHADLVLEKSAGAGVAELLRGAQLVEAESIASRRWRLDLGRSPEGARVSLPASRINVLVAGRSKSGKSFFMGMLAEQLIGLGYSVCIIDPEGDYAPLGELRGVLALGGQEELPPVERIGRLFEHRFASVVIDVSSSPPEERQEYVTRLHNALAAERRSTGLPHWILCDEAHEQLGGNGVSELLASEPKGYCLATWRPHELSAEARRALDFVVAISGGKELLVGEGPDTIAEIESICGFALPDLGAPNEGVLLRPGRPSETMSFAIHPRRSPHVRHWRKYAEGRLPAHLRFQFRNEVGTPRGVAANIQEIHRTLRSCAPSVLRFHALRGDLSRWLREAIQDGELAGTIGSLEEVFSATSRSDVDAERLRHAVLGAVERRYSE